MSFLSPVHVDTGATRAGLRDMVLTPAAIRDGRADTILDLCAAGRGRREGAALLQAADGTLARIAKCLAAMRVMAGQAAAPTRSEAERRALNDLFTARRSDVDRLAVQASFNGAALLCGGTREICEVPRLLRRRFLAASLGYRLHDHMGFEGFVFCPDAPNLLAGDVLRVEYEAGAGRIVVTNMTTGRRSLAAAPRRAPAIGSVLAVAVPAFGLRIVTNEDFLVGRDNRAQLDNPGHNEFVLQADHDWGAGAAMRDRAHFRFGADAGPATVTLESARLEEMDEALIRASILTVDEAAAALLRVERACERLAEMRASCARARAALCGGSTAASLPDGLPTALLPPDGRKALRLVTPRAVPAMRRLLLQ